MSSHHRSSATGKRSKGSRSHARNGSASDNGGSLQWYTMDGEPMAPGEEAAAVPPPPPAKRHKPAAAIDDAQVEATQDPDAYMDAAASSSSSSFDAASSSLAPPASYPGLSSQETELGLQTQENESLPLPLLPPLPLPTVNEHEEEKVEIDTSQSQSQSTQPPSHMTYQQAVAASASHAAAPAPALPSRTPSQRDRKQRRAFDELQEEANAAALAAQQAAAANAALQASHAHYRAQHEAALRFQAAAFAMSSTHSHSDIMSVFGSAGLPSFMHAAAAAGSPYHSMSAASAASPAYAQPRPRPRPVTRDRGNGLKVPKSSEHWIVVGVWVASRDFPEIPFWLPLIEPATGRKLVAELPVPYKSLMATLSPKYNDRERILLHSRVVQRIDSSGKLFGEVRYLCTDIAVSYHMGDNAFKWISFHPTIFQVCCSTWNSSLNRAELEDHLQIACSKGGMVFQAPEAEHTRRFLKCILMGKGIKASCALKPMSALQQQMAAQGLVIDDPAAMAANGIDPNSSNPPQLTLQNLPHAMQLFGGALSRTPPLWFHPTFDLRTGGSAASAKAHALQAGDDDDEAESVVDTVSVASSRAMSRSRSLPASAHSTPRLSSSHSAASSADVSTSRGSGSSRTPQRKQSSKAKEVTERPPLQLSLLPYVQFISVAQPATARHEALPSVHICNTLRPGASVRFAGGLPMSAASTTALAAAYAAATASSSAVAAAATTAASARKHASSSSAASSGTVARSRKARRSRKPSPVPDEEDEAEDEDEEEQGGDDGSQDAGDDTGQHDDDEGTGTGDEGGNTSLLGQLLAAVDPADESADGEAGADASASAGHERTEEEDPSTLDGDDELQLHLSPNDPPPAVAEPDDNEAAPESHAEASAAADGLAALQTLATLVPDLSAPVAHTPSHDIAPPPVTVLPPSEPVAVAVTAVPLPASPSEVERRKEALRAQAAIIQAQLAMLDALAPTPQQPATPQPDLLMQSYKQATDKQAR